MVHGRRSAWSVVMVLALAAAGCRAAKTGPGASAGAPITGMGVPAPADIVFQAELAPINALAADREFLWIGSDRGLRRVRLSDDKVEWLPLGGSTGDASAGVGGAPGAPLLTTVAVAADLGGSAGGGPRRVTALAAGGEGAIWVGTDVGLGRAAEVGGKLGFQPLVPLTGITQVAPLRTPAPAAARPGGSRGGPGAEAVWVGTDHGLFLVRGGVASVVPGVGKAAITFLTIDDEDGQAAWAGVRGRGLLRVERQHIAREIGPAGPSPIDFLDPVGMARLANGTPFAIGRGRDGASKLVQLHPEGAEPLAAEPAIKVWGLVPTEAGPLVFAGEPGASSAYRLEAVERGKLLQPGAFRFVQERRNLQGLRVAARPDPRALPAELTVWIAAAEGVFMGTRAAGVVRLGDEPVREAAAAPEEPPAPAAGAVRVVTKTTTSKTTTGTAATDPGRPPEVIHPEYLPVGELAAQAGALSVACIERDRCVVGTGAGPGWIWDGQTGAFRPVPTEALGGPLMALGGDGEGAVYFMAADGPKGIKVARLSSDGARWDPLITLQVTTEGAPVVSAATVSPQGSLWMSIRSRASSGEESGRGVIELQLPSGKAIHHHAARAGEPRSPEAIPISGDVRAVRSQAGNSGTPDALWFCTSLGVLRSAEGKLTRWSENDGLSSDSCNDLAILDGGATVWVATNRGASRFDGKTWIPFDGAPPVAGAPRRWPRTRHRGPADRDQGNQDEDDLEVLAARAFVTAGGGLWAATPRGIWPLTGSGRPFDSDSGLVDEDVRDLVVDRFGRMWGLGHVGLTVTGTFPRH